MKKWLNRFVFSWWIVITCEVVAVPVDVPVDLRRPEKIDPKASSVPVLEGSALLGSIKTGNKFVIEFFNLRQHPEDKSWSKIVGPLLSMSTDEYMASVFGPKYGDPVAVLCTAVKLVDVTVSGKTISLRYETRIIGESRWGDGLAYGVFEFVAYKHSVIYTIDIHLNDLAKIAALKVQEPQEAVFSEKMIGVLRAYIGSTGAGSGQSDSKERRLSSYRVGVDGIRSAEKNLCN